MNGEVRTEGLAPPPEGVLTGESVPRENERTEKERVAIQRLARTMKGYPAFSDLSDAELREKAVQRLQQRGVIQ